MIVVLVVLLSVVIGGVFFLYKSYSETNNIRTVGNAFLQAAIANDPQVTYAMLTDRLKESIGDESVWTKSLSDAFANKNVSFEFEKQVPISNPETTYPKDGSPERLVYTLTYEDGKVYRMHIVVLKEKNGLKVDEFNSFLK